MAFRLSTEYLASASARRPLTVIGTWALILDATIVRSVLVPAAMQLLGAANWYLPPVLRWLPELRTEGAMAPESANG